MFVTYADGGNVYDKIGKLTQMQGFLIKNYCLKLYLKNKQAKRLHTWLANSITDSRTQVAELTILK